MYLKQINHDAICIYLHTLERTNGIRQFSLIEEHNLGLHICKSSIDCALGTVHRKSNITFACINFLSYCIPLGFLYMGCMSTRAGSTYRNPLAQLSEDKVKATH
jgi:hypothetical protein